MNRPQLQGRRRHVFTECAPPVDVCSTEWLGLAWVRATISVNVVGEVGFARHADRKSVLDDELYDGHSLRRRISLRIFAVVPDGTVGFLDALELGIDNCKLGGTPVEQKPPACQRTDACNR